MTMSGCDAKPYPTIQLLPGGDWYYALGKHNSSVWLGDPKLQMTLRQHKCQAFNNNFSLPNSPSISFTMLTLYNFFKCNSSSNNTPNITQKKNDTFAGYKMYNGCEGFSIYYKRLGDDNVKDIQADNLPANCSLITLPIHSLSSDGDLFHLLGPEFLVEWELSDDCYQCHYSGGQCQTDITNNFCCHKDAKTTRRSMMGLILAAVFGGVGLVMITCLVVYLILHYKKRKFCPSRFLSTKKFSDIFKHDVEGGSIFFGVPVFSYSELEEATNDFNSSRVLGDGGFGTVYYGKLKDGREVAVKRLYEHNCKRMEQFINEIEILTRLRHNNLVTLYGCTSSRSRELLLVYEYILNGTLADHLHGRRAKQRSLSWPIRMNIAIETAGALAYLHACDVIHCDVKTNNILLDQNFSVKVADFGISRLFPNDVSHISTAPRGTPGYIDPKYHECYQLTSKSDVYSFGVVLVELISSMPAVDMSRHSQEINLANFAINKIVKCAFKELIDPSLLFDSNTKIWEMTTLVAELAFLCLQTDRDMRPTMTEVLDTLKEIQTSAFDNEKRAESNLNDKEAKIVSGPPFPESENLLLLKQVKSLPSPNSVTDNWITCYDINNTK
ncbi:PREDICTED: LEAF RUST 10 DISEASE-RESISTANCE LOCUS RECEPTOR-LIKE PROTEIN KINASE-like 1.1 isoform X2 [Nicotiana attenuata]|uniref:Leaf rust 10 disease-resistance locus receptor-like protein kinase-like 1.1 n=2 Tax=Nicotiana attenuata TaxID=49451 RepID=A0A1J6HTL2_NICAT|nr:PREDICTED: LEAF RUST 10 DISEASE-RESISTANCE LOCUS RECEPTOR-LIKE PROTEIN KINASE-like 1.1 isoform X2 [Nicotiana attenuata]XP_019256780.1 PREDICTED: LEAF RUST 10 DISEASE-RESISTANCE LOCUS RECEPTOR-LIKE PROTEIN KINASE-like 1.1 isoform X2 [Nicotiana attenuata]OIS95737.1 leaf rust 10 disease-resistance locus receptor-like protein kinase-like 1.1 [Nicotiana attenuata]